MKSVTLFLSVLWSSMLGVSAVAADWQPLKPVELIVPAGPGGGADQMAHLMQEVVAKYRLMPQPIVVINKPGNSGAEGFLLIKQNRGNSHQLVVTLSNIFTAPIATGADFSWRDLTPISLMALDEFVLWVNAEAPYRSAKQYIDAVRAAPGKFKMGGTGSLQEDEIVTRALEHAAGVKFKYVALKGGGDVAQALADKNVDSTLNNPIEALKHWSGGKVRPLGVFDSQPIGSTEPIVGDAGWNSIPTMKGQGYNIEYLMMRGIFAAPEIPRDAKLYYVEVMARITRTPEWQAYLQKGALKHKYIIGNAFHSWLTFAETMHQSLMAK